MRKNKVNLRYLLIGLFSAIVICKGRKKILRIRKKAGPPGAPEMIC